MLVNLKEILKIAEEDKSAIGMFNATGFDSLQAVIGAAEELNKPVIIAHAEVHNVFVYVQSRLYGSERSNCKWKNKLFA